MEISLSHAPALRRYEGSEARVIVRSELSVLRRSWRSLLPLIFFALSSLPLIFWYAADCLFSRGSAYSYSGLSACWLLLVPLVLALEILRRRFDSSYLFTFEGVQVKKGYLSLQLQMPQVKYRDIRAIMIQQSLLGRLLNYGTITLETAARSEYRLLLCGVAFPLEMAQMLDKLRSHSMRNIIGAPQDGGCEFLVDDIELSTLDKVKRPRNERVTKDCDKLVDSFIEEQERNRPKLIKKRIGGTQLWPDLSSGSLVYQSDIIESKF